MATTEQDRGVGPEDGRPATTPRQQARERLQTRRDFGSHLVAYIVINAFLVGAWLLTGGGYFWPAWVMAAWGAGLVLHAWEAFVRRPVTEEDVEAELRRQQR